MLRLSYRNEKEQAAILELIQKVVAIASYANYIDASSSHIVELLLNSYFVAFILLICSRLASLAVFNIDLLGEK